MTINEDAAREAIGAVLRNRVLFIGDTSTRYSGVPGLLIDDLVSALKALPEEGWKDAKADPPKLQGEYQAAWLWRGKWCQEVCQFSDGLWWGWNDIADEYNLQRDLVSHYRPLPAPPEAPKEET